MRKENCRQTAAIDLGWYPDGDPYGAYRSAAVLDDDFPNPVLEFTSRSTREIVDILEYWLFECLPCSTIDEKRFRKLYPDKK